MQFKDSIYGYFETFSSRLSIEIKSIQIIYELQYCVINQVVVVSQGCGEEWKCVRMPDEFQILNAAFEIFHFNFIRFGPRGQQFET